MRRTVVTAILLASLGSVGPSPVVVAEPLSLTRQERNFIREALSDSLAERTLGKLAQDRGETRPVRAFARRMVDEHALIAERLIGYAERHDLPVSDELPLTARAILADLEDAPAGRFGRRYMAAEEESHARAIKLFEAQAMRDGETAAFARDTLPVLRAQFDDARAIIADLGNAPAPPQTQAPP